MYPLLSSSYESLSYRLRYCHIQHQDAARSKRSFYVIAYSSRTQNGGQGQCAICLPSQRHSRSGAVEAEVTSRSGESRAFCGHDDVAGSHELAPSGGGQLSRRDPCDDWNRQPFKKFLCCTNWTFEPRNASYPLTHPNMSSMSSLHALNTRT